jgi:hypothetical protein
MEKLIDLSLFRFPEAKLHVLIIFIDAATVNRLERSNDDILNSFLSQNSIINKISSLIETTISADLSFH